VQYVTCNNNAHVHATFFVADSMGIFIQTFVVGSDRHCRPMYNVTERTMAVQGSMSIQGQERSLILVPIQSAHATSYTDEQQPWSYLAPFRRFGVGRKSPIRTYLSCI